MIYLDNAATSLLKPKSIEAAMMRAMATMASPGRGGHKPAMLAADTALDCRQAVSRLFGMSDPEKVIFTLNATHALNIAIYSLVKNRDRVVISGYEHNAVTKPLHAIGARVAVASSPLFDPVAALEAFESRLLGAKAAICCHVSNVFGYILPLEEIAGLCRYYGVPLIVDASQSAGVLDIDFSGLGAEFMAMPGHKGLLGPQGTGILLCRNSAEPILHGGTGSNSAIPDMPDFLPDRLEAGTHNITGIAGLLAGVRFVMRQTPAAILEHERRLCGLMADRLERIPGVRVYRAVNPEHQTGVLSVTVDGISCEAIAEALGARDVAVRAGLHCSPTAHRTAGTLETGTVRFSFSPFNTIADVEKAAKIFGSVIKNL
ncbi:MAG TPA: aminotransferase class V-fold PLP-dependent enzyme [Clostridiales bacterium]|nr:aminotransferase class V-fold PLP-dependent enzyme [Clostridiales bacterium]